MNAARCAWLALPLTFAAGCLSLLPVAPTPRDYRPDYTPPMLQHQRLPVVLRLAPVRVAAIYDREPFAYRRGPYRVGYYYYHRWATAPGQMLTDFFVRDFTLSGLYRAVQQGPSVLLADYQLDLRVERLEEEVKSAGCTAAIVVQATLQSLRPGAANPVRLQQVYTEVEQTRCNDPESFVAGVSQILSRLSRALQEDVYAAIAASEGEGLGQTSLFRPLPPANARPLCVGGLS
ncbi:hypothetical protein HRbin30_01564 [bacterium HR30]|nr:hypothetical protein HRbin30_01564 [bacterium HR30]